MTRRVRLDFEGVFAPATRAPDADDVAHALVKAARSTLELRSLADGATAVLAGALPLRARWLAFAALREVWPRCLGGLGRRWADGANASLGLRRARAASWWNDQVVSDIAFDLLDAHRR